LGKTSRPKINWGLGSFLFSDCAESPPSPPPGTEIINKKKIALRQQETPTLKLSIQVGGIEITSPAPSRPDGGYTTDSINEFLALFLPSRPDERPVVRRRAKEHRAKLRWDRRHDSALRCVQKKVARRDRGQT
jgi:hypothetical protein